MPMSDGKNTLKKIAFQIGDVFFRFAINPQNLQYAKPHRTTAVKTKSRIIVEDFQNDIPTITLSGTMGFNPTGKAADRGTAKMKELKQFLDDYSQMGGNGNSTSEDFLFHDFTNDESWVVTLAPEGFTVTQDVTQPLLHTYEIKLIILRNAALPAEDEVVNPQIGNTTPSIATNGTAPSSTYGTVQLPSTSSSVPSLGTTPPPSIQQGSVASTYNSGITSPGSSTGSSPSSGSGSGSNTNSGGVYDPTSGNPNIYNSGTVGPYVPSQNGSDPINPQAPSPNAYHYGMTGLGFNIGYYGRSY